jgi:hypothetical protein
LIVDCCSDRFCYARDLSAPGTAKTASPLLAVWRWARCSGGRATEEGRVLGLAGETPKRSGLAGIAMAEAMTQRLT